MPWYTSDIIKIEKGLISSFFGHIKIYLFTYSHLCSSEEWTRRPRCLEPPSCSDLILSHWSPGIQLLLLYMCKKQRAYDYARNVLNGIQESKISLLFLGLLFILDSKKHFEFCGSTVWRVTSAGRLKEQQHHWPEQKENMAFVLLTLPACSHIQIERLFPRLSIHISGGLRKHAVNLLQTELHCMTLQHLKVNHTSCI